MVNKSLKQPPPASTAKASETQKNFVLILLKLFLREIYCLIGIQQTFTNKELSTRVQRGGPYINIKKKILINFCLISPCLTS